MGDDLAHSTRRRRSNSITEYSALFSQNTPRPSNFIGQKRHPSLSIRPDRTSTLGKIGNLATLASNSSNESAIDDSEPRQSSTSNLGTVKGPDDAVGLGRRLSQGARAIMYNGNRLRGESINSATAVTPGRTLSVGSTASMTESSNACSPIQSQDIFTPVDLPAPIESDKVIRRRMSPTGERMLRGELAFH